MNTNTRKMKIREAKLDDAESMGRVTVETFFVAYENLVPPEVIEARKRNWTHADSEQAWARTLRRIESGDGSRECVYVAEDSPGKLIGVAMGAPASADHEESVGTVLSLSVNPAHHRLGVGTALVWSVAAHLARMGMTALEIEVLETNDSAHRFYKALGGQVIRESEIEDEGVPLRSLIFAWPDIRTLNIGAAL